MFECKRLIPLLVFAASISVLQAQTFDIYGTKVRTGATERLTLTNDADEFNPSWSPNRHHIVHDALGGTIPSGHSIYITNVHTGANALFAEGGNDADWSPVSADIVYDKVPVGDPSIYTGVSGSTAPHRLVKANAVSPDFNSSGKWIVYQSMTDGFLHITDLYGSVDRNLGVPGANPSWSPNNQWIAYDYMGDIWKIRLGPAYFAVGAPVAVTANPYNEGQPTWKNNSRYLAFHTDQFGGFDIGYVFAGGGSPSYLAGDSENQFDPAFSRNGKFVAYAGFTPAAIPPIAAKEELPAKSLIVNQNHPNPFNPETTISFALAEEAAVKITVFNSQGQHVQTLTDHQFSAGEHAVRWNGRNFTGAMVASGTYFYRVRVGSLIEVRRMNLLK
ncbi:MAG: T9SS C-terminal target domain-containing protein [Calditrichaeota bacterium]|nr:MAG: T9SS C-terminal target domain-containing protein [Calditrichota bacterium]